MLFSVFAKLSGLIDDLLNGLYHVSMSSRRPRGIPYWDLVLYFSRLCRWTCKYFPHVFLAQFMSGSSPGGRDGSRLYGLCIWFCSVVFLMRVPHVCTCHLR